VFWSSTSGSLQHGLDPGQQRLWSDFRFVLLVRKCVLPEGVAKEPSKLDLVSVEYHVGAPDA